MRPLAPARLSRTPLTHVDAGALLTADGSDDDNKIQLEGVPKGEKFEIPRA